MADPANAPPLERPSVIAAHALIKEYIHYTPVLTNTTLNDLASTPQSASTLAGTPWAGQEPTKPKIRFWFKCENFQKVGAFKVRGAFHALKRLMAEQAWEEISTRGVVTHSSGGFALIPLSHLLKTISDCMLHRQPRTSPRPRSPYNGRPCTHRNAHHIDTLQDSSHERLRRHSHLLWLDQHRTRSGCRRYNKEDWRKTYTAI